MDNTSILRTVTLRVELMLCNTGHVVPLYYVMEEATNHHVGTTYGSLKDACLAFFRAAPVTSERGGQVADLLDSLGEPILTERG
jgi:hypothetical protein